MKFLPFLVESQDLGPRIFPLNPEKSQFCSALLPCSRQEPQLPPPISSRKHWPSLGISPYFLVLEQPLNPEFPDLFCFASSSLCCPPAAMWV
ncbi:hypothetical protein SLEP1_g57952 [Rubroshorea leprosula]|uniref:Uncharacterized protein n=1 Tax=Rubroshorea leprosula TaxID=152421 RepID=A0AAV5MQ63_9ROSI|nr:hypothetical protein SLEP1_g57952 [Rubroshorea leprosula]